MDKKKYIKPELEVIEFAKEDIIVTSANGSFGETGYTDGDINKPTNPSPWW